METRQADRICAILEDMVLTGQFQQGERLDEASLAEKFGVSRTPIREALQRLVTAGLARQIPRRGVFVQHPNSVGLIDMFETMAEMEGVCTRLAVQRITPENLERLREINSLCRDAAAAKDAAGYSRHNEAFHNLLYHIAGNGFLENEALRIFALLKPFRRIQFRTTDRMAQSLAEHIALIDALEAGDEQKAATLARRHVASQGERFFDQMARLRRAPDFQRAG